jgi:hypothetical protein
MKSNVYYPRQKPTYMMSDLELARVWAHHHGLYASRSGWLRKGSDPITQGYVDLASILARAGVIVPGSGIDWRAGDAQGITPEWVAAVRRHEDARLRAARRQG